MRTQWVSKTQLIAEFIAILGSLFSATACVPENLQPLQQAALPAPRQTLQLKINQFCPDGQFKDFWVSNLSAIVKSGTVLMDRDRDGLPDYLDNNPTYGVSPFSADTNGDGYSDLLVFLAGLTLDQQTNLPYCENPTLDTDGDGLTDCEERNITHTDPLKWDTDGDGIPDGVEVRVGLNPRDGQDALGSPAGDGLNALQKIKRHIPVYESRSLKGMAELEYKYDTVTTQNESKTCFDFTVSNITLTNVPNGNLIQAYFIVTGFDGSTTLKTLDLPPVSRSQAANPANIETSYINLVGAQ